MKVETAGTEGLIYEFGPFRVDAAKRALQCGGQPVPLTPKAFDLLLILVEHTGEVLDKDTLMRMLWPDSEVEEANLPQNISLLRKALGETPGERKYIATVPGRGYKFAAEVKGVSNDGRQLVSRGDADFTVNVEGQEEIAEATASSSRTEMEKVEPSLPRFRSRHSWMVIALAVVLLAGGFFIYRVLTPAASRRIDSIAVLPFQNENGHEEMEYLSDGMTEMLISNLSQLPKLSVKARSSIFRYKGKEVDPKTVGKELNVQAVLNGRVVQHGDEVTLYLSLVDTETENQLWGKQYTRKVTSLVALQAEIARDVSERLKTRLTGADEQRLGKDYTDNPQAYQLYLKGRFYWNKRMPEKAIECFQKAIALDPSYALAYAGLADAYGQPREGLPPRERMPKAREAALKALSLDGRLAEAHTALGQILTRYDYDFAGGEREFQLAIELNPRYATAHQRYGELLTYQGRFAEASAEYSWALELEPLSLAINQTYGESLVLARRYDEAIMQLQKTLELEPDFSLPFNFLSIAYQMTGKQAESVEARARVLEGEGDQQSATLVRESYAKGGWQAYLQFMCGERRPATLAFFILATYQAALGERDNAFAALDKSYENREFPFRLLKVDPRLDPLRDDPRYQELLRKVGFPQ